MPKSDLGTSVLLVGPYSYIGGVSVHMKRLAHILDKDFEIGILDDAPTHISGEYHNIRKWRQFPGNIRYIWCHDIVHVHTGNWMLRIGMIVLSLLLMKKVVVTMHSYRLKGFPRVATQVFLRLAHHVICVNEIIYQSVANKCKSLKEAFIPPVEPGCGLRGEVDRLLHNNKGRYILCANAFRLSEYQGGDLYGLDQCIQVAKIAKKEKDNIVIIFVVGRVDSGDQIYFKAIEKISRCELSGYIHIIPYGVDFVELIRRSDVVLRPTLTDGDALTVREALFLGKPVIASDVVPRPEGTTLYRKANAPDLYRVIKSVILGRTPSDSLSVLPSGQGLEGYSDYYREIYRKYSGKVE